jgi:hypothetical protein
VNEFAGQGMRPGLPLGPMSLSQALDRIVKILRQHFWLFLQLGTVPAGAFLAMYALIFAGLFAFGVIPPHPGTPPDPQRMAWVLFPVVLVAMIPMMIAYALFEGAASLVALAANRGGETSFFAAYGAAWNRLGRIVWLMILRSLCISLPFIAAFGVAGTMGFAFIKGGQSANPGIAFVLVPLLVLGYLGSMVYAVWMALRMALALPACLSEDLSAFEALKRSSVLTRGSMGRIFLVALVVYAISCAAIMVLEMAGLLVGAVLSLIGSTMHLHLTQPWTAFGVGVLAVGLLGVFLLFMTLSWASYAITFSVLYDGQRVRMEGTTDAPGGKPA